MTNGMNYTRESLVQALATKPCKNSVGLISPPTFKGSLTTFPKAPFTCNQSTHVVEAGVKERNLKHYGT